MALESAKLRSVAHPSPVGACKDPEEPFLATLAKASPLNVGAQPLPRMSMEYQSSVTAVAAESAANEVNEFLGGTQALDL